MAAFWLCMNYPHRFSDHESFHRLPEHQEVDHSVLSQVQSHTRSPITKLLREAGDKMMTAAAVMFLLSVVVLCAGNAGFEWAREKFGWDE